MAQRGDDGGPVEVPPVPGEALALAEPVEPSESVEARRALILRAGLVEAVEVLSRAVTDADALEAAVLEAQVLEAAGVFEHAVRRLRGRTR